MKPAEAIAFAERVRAVGPMLPNSPACLVAVVSLLAEVERLNALLPPIDRTSPDYP